MSSDLKVVGSEQQENSSPEKREPVEVAHQPGMQEHYLGGAYSSDTIKKIRKDPQVIRKDVHLDDWPHK